MNFQEFKTYFTEYQIKRGWERWYDRDYEVVFDFNNLSKITYKQLMAFQDHITATNAWKWSKADGCGRFTEAYKAFRDSTIDSNHQRYDKPPSGGCTRPGCSDGILSVVYFYTDKLVKVMPYIPNYRNPPGKFAEMRAETGAIRCDCVGEDRYASFRDIWSYGGLWGE